MRGRHVKEETMPVLLLWTGIPILLIGGGFIVYRVIAG